MKDGGECLSSSDDGREVLSWYLDLRCAASLEGDRIPHRSASSPATNCSSSGISPVARTQDWNSKSIQSCKVSRVWPTLRREMLLSVLWSVWRWRPSSLTRELFERLRFYSPVDLPHTHCSYWLSPHWTSPRYRTQSPYLSFWIVSSLYSLFMFRVEFPVKSRSK